MAKLIGIQEGVARLTFKEYLARTDLHDKKKLVVEAPESLLKTPQVWSRLDEATRATVGRFTARRDPPHFQGDEYHAHADVPGGYEVSWNVSGTRRHENKFPAQIPKDARAAVAKVLGVKPTKLEGHIILDPALGRLVYLIEVTSVNSDGQEN